MRPDFLRAATPKRQRARACAHALQRGFALASAIFLLVVLAALGAFMIHFSTVQHATSAQDMNGSKAYQAARAGMEWGVYQVLRNPAFACGGNTTLAPLAGALSGFAVNVQCTFVQATEGQLPNNVNLYRISSRASLGASGSPNYVERELQAQVER